MSILSSIASLFERKNRVAVTQVQRAGEARMMDRNARAYTVEGYQQNVIVFRCVDIIAKALASIPLVVRRGDEISYEHPVLDIVSRPNPLQGKADFLQTVVAYRLVTGNSYIEKIRVSGGITEIWPWMPYHMRVIVDPKDPMPKGYVYDNGQVKHGWEIDDNGVSDILHWKTFNPTNISMGMSPIQACAHAVDQHNEAGRWNMRMLQNSAVPDGAFVTEMTLTDSQFKQLSTRLKEQYSGPENARRSMILEGGLQWQTLAMSPKDMDWLNGRNISAQDIAAAFGVPLQVIPIPGSQTFANYEQARLALYEDTVIPLLDDLLGEINRWIGEEELGEYELWRDIDDVPALEPRRAARWTSVSGANWLTTNEKREATGYDKVEQPEADEVLIPSNLIPLGAPPEPEVDATAQEAIESDARMAEADAADEEGARLLAEARGEQ